MTMPSRCRSLAQLFVLSLACWLAGAALSRTAAAQDGVEAAVDLLVVIIDVDENTARECLQLLAKKVQSREVADDQLKRLTDRLRELLDQRLAKPPTDPLYLDSALLAATVKHPKGAAAARKIAEDGAAPTERRLQALAALLFAGDEQGLKLAASLMSATTPATRELRSSLIGLLGQSDSAEVATIALSVYSRLEPDLQPKVVELLTQRPAWSKALLDAIGKQQIPAQALNANQVAKLLASRDPQLQELVRAKWGSVRAVRNPQREQVIAQMRERLKRETGDPHKGQLVFRKVCGQCHKIHGEGQEVGPDITANGRASVAQLLSNVFDPSLVIGASYQARTVITNDGRVLTGLVVEDNAQRVVLKVQGGKQETIARDDIDELKVSELSLMPEGLETQLQGAELIDLLAFLLLDKPPTDPAARRIPDDK